VSGKNIVTTKNYIGVEESLEVLKKLYRLHIELCYLKYEWSREEKYELVSRSRRASNNAPVRVAEKSASFKTSGFNYCGYQS